REDGQYCVLKIVKGKTVRTPVTIAYKGTDRAEISEGLAEGDSYVINANINEITADMRVDPVYP
nr:hypothetical protein [Lachnospiraceae bacterium]